MDIRKRSSIRPVRESELPIVSIVSQREQSLGRGKGQSFHQVSEGGKGGDCRWGWKLQRRSGNFRGNYIGRPSRKGCESRWKKMIGKPYSGKLNVRFDEGELEIGP